MKFMSAVDQFPRYKQLLMTYTANVFFIKFRIIYFREYLIQIIFYFFKPRIRVIILQNRCKRDLKLFEQKKYP